MLYECLCFNLFVVCQNEDLKHVAGIVTRKQEEKNTKNDTYLCDGEGVFIWGEVPKPRESKQEYFLNWELKGCIQV